MLMTPHGASLEKSCTVPWAVFVGKSPGSVGNVFQDWVANMTTAGKIIIFWGVESLSLKIIESILKKGYGPYPYLVCNISEPPKVASLFFCRELFINSNRSSYIKSFSPWFIDFSY